MEVYTKYRPVNIITNLMVIDLYSARQLYRKDADHQLRAELIVAIDAINFELERIFERVDARALPAHAQEELAAAALADCRRKFNIANLRHKFIAQDGKNFLVKLKRVDRKTEKIATTTPHIVCRNISRAVAEPEIVHVEVTLFEKRQDRITAESLYNFGATEPFLEQMFELDTARYIDIALAAANVAMILKFARRPPQEYRSQWYRRAEKSHITGGM